MRALCTNAFGYSGLTPLDIELQTLDQIAVLCLSQEQLDGGRRIVKLSVSEARNAGIIPPAKPGQLQSKVQRVRAAKAAKEAAAKAKAKADRRESRRQRRERKGRR